MIYTKRSGNRCVTLLYFACMMQEKDTTICIVGSDMQFKVADFSTLGNQEELSVSFAISMRMSL
jgi:hypothetical protein